MTAVPGTAVTLYFPIEDKADPDLSTACDEAIRQIEENGYAKLKPEGYRQQIVYGIAFYAKTARVIFLQS